MLHPNPSPKGRQMVMKRKEEKNKKYQQVKSNKQEIGESRRGKKKKKGTFLPCLTMRGKVQNEKRGGGKKERGQSLARLFFVKPTLQQQSSDKRAGYITREHSLDRIQVHPPPSFLLIPLPSSSLPPAHPPLSQVTLNLRLPQRSNRMLSRKEKKVKK